MRYFMVILFLSTVFGMYGQKYAEELEDTIYARVDEPPSFPNGDAEMYDHISEKLFLEVPTFYQDRIVREGYHTLLRFVVDQEGEIHDVQADNRSTHFFLLDELQETFYNMPTWVPGRVDGNSVNTLVYLELDMRVTAGGVFEIKYHPLFPDSLLWERKKMSKKDKRLAALAAILITGFFAFFILSGQL